MFKNFALCLPVGPSDKLLELGYVDANDADNQGVLYFRDADTHEVIITASVYPLEAKRLREYLFTPAPIPTKAVKEIDEGYQE